MLLTALLVTGCGSGSSPSKPDVAAPTPLTTTGSPRKTPNSHSASSKEATPSSTTTQLPAEAAALVKAGRERMRPGPSASGRAGRDLGVVGSALRRLTPRQLAGAMAKKKRKRKKANEKEAAEMRIVADEKAPGISATALATFARDLAAFGSRADRPARGPTQ